MRQREQRRDGRGLRELAIRAFEVEPRVVAHVGISLLHGVRLRELIGISHANVKAAQVADRTRRGAWEIVHEKATAAWAARLHISAVVVLQHRHMGAVAKRDQSARDLYRRRRVSHGRAIGYSLRRESRHRTSALHDCALWNDLTDFQSTHRVLGHREFAIQCVALEWQILLRHHTRQRAEDMRLVARASGFEVSQREPVLRHRDAGSSLAEIDVVVALVRHRLLQLRDDHRGQSLPHHARHGEFDGALRIVLDELLEHRTPSLNKRKAFGHQAVLFNG